MPVMDEITTFVTNYVRTLEDCRALANALAVDINDTFPNGILVGKTEFVDEDYLRQYLEDNPLPTTAINDPSTINITSMQTTGLEKSYPLYVGGFGRVTSRKVLPTEITTPSGSVPYSRLLTIPLRLLNNGTATSNNPTFVPTNGTLAADELLCIEDGVPFTFPSTLNQKLLTVFESLNNMKVGERAYIGCDTVPPDFIIEDGREVYKSEYPNLYTLMINHGFGSVMGSSDPDKFKVLDRRGLFSVINGESSSTELTRATGTTTWNGAGSIAPYPQYSTKYRGPEGVQHSGKDGTKHTIASYSFPVYEYETRHSYFSRGVKSGDTPVCIYCTSLGGFPGNTTRDGASIPNYLGEIVYSAVIDINDTLISPDVAYAGTEVGDETRPTNINLHSIVRGR